MQRNNRSRTSEFGGMMLYILVGVVLFGMLILAYTKNTNVSGGVATKGQMTTKAAQVIDFSNQVNSTVEKMLVSGCSETEIDFGGTTGENWYWNNATSPSDKRCTVFSDRGGKLTRQNPPPGIGKVGGTYSLTGYYEYKGREAFPGHGVSTCDEIFIAIRGLNKEFCEAVNKQLGIPGVPVKQISGGTDLSGGGYSPTSCGPWAGEGVWNNPVIQGKRQFCVSNVGATDYYFINIILAR